MSRDMRRVGGLSVCSRGAATVLAVMAVVVQPPIAYADRPEPVPLYGAYDTYLDHSKQTFDGRLQPSDPAVQAASFTTTCNANGCTAHWFRLSDLAENPSAPALFDYRWNGDRWDTPG